MGKNSGWVIDPLFWCDAEKKYKNGLTNPCAAHKKEWCNAQNNIEKRKMKMEQQVKDGLNFILGAVNTAKVEAEKAFSNINTGFQSLAAKGAQDQSEVSVNLRKYLQEGISQVETIIGKANTVVAETKAKVATVTSKA
ncbi:hypothetical protein LEP1GSC017_1224 [Leptospira meyeri serovar Hardjo str. Went 5]|nr:hypothetical protein LEP1GSC017_1224 [Leptospira meyeri serovar Hardjo str. Went 5]